MDYILIAAFNFIDMKKIVSEILCMLGFLMSDIEMDSEIVDSSVIAKTSR